MTSTEGTSTIATQELTAGKLFAGRFEILGKIGAGNYGTVFKARDIIQQQKLVALKVLFPSPHVDDIVRARFRREYQLASAIHHPNVVEFYCEGASDDGWPFIAMEYVEGTPLSTLINATKEHPIKFGDAVYVMVQMASALSTAHKAGVIHRDIKPDNVLIAKHWTAKLLDFGVGRFEDSGLRLTVTDDIIGTGLYLAPDQLDSKRSDHRADVYSLGLVGYEMLSGKPAFLAATWQAAVHKHLHQPMPYLEDLELSIPSWYDDVLQKACAKDKDKRYQSMDEILAELVPHLGDKEVITRSDAYAANQFEPLARLPLPQPPPRKSLLGGVIGKLFGSSK